MKQLAEIAKIHTKLDLIKAVGIGLSIALQQFEHQIPGEKSTFAAQFYSSQQNS